MRKVRTERKVATAPGDDTHLSVEQHFPVLEPPVDVLLADTLRDDFIAGAISDSHECAYLLGRLWNQIRYTAETITLLTGTDWEATDAEELVLLSPFRLRFERLLGTLVGMRQSMGANGQVAADLENAVDCFATAMGGPKLRRRIAAEEGDPDYEEWEPQEYVDFQAQLLASVLSPFRDSLRELLVGQLTNPSSACFALGEAVDQGVRPLRIKPQLRQLKTFRSWLMRSLNGSPKKKLSEEPQEVTPQEYEIWQSKLDGRYAIVCQELSLSLEPLDLRHCADKEKVLAADGQIRARLRAVPVGPYCGDNALSVQVASTAAGGSWFTLLGRQVDIPDMRAAKFLRLLWEHRGQYVKAAQIEAALGIREGVRPRSSRLIEHLKPLKGLIESAPGVGSRFSTEKLERLLQRSQEPDFDLLGCLHSLAEEARSARSQRRRDESGKPADPEACPGPSA